MNYDWDWSIFTQTSPDGAGTYIDALLTGLKWTVLTAGLAWVIALLLGSLLGILRTNRGSPIANFFSFLATCYIELFRNVPLLLQMFIWFFVLPEMLPARIGDYIKSMSPPWGSFIPAVLCLGLFTAVRVCEQLRAGIESLPKGQRMAATALGLTTFQVYTKVLLPTSFRIILPPLTSEAMNIVKNSSIALTIGLLEIMGSARSMQEFTFKPFEAFAAATTLYLILNLIVVVVMRLIEKKMSVPGFAGAPINITH